MGWPMKILKAKSCKSTITSTPNIPSGSHLSIEIGDTSVQDPVLSSSAGKNQNVQDQVDMPYFSVSPERLAELVESNGLNSPDHPRPTIQEISEALRTSIDSGITGDEKDLDCRIKTFGSNQESDKQPQLGTKGLNRLVLEAFKDGTIILLVCCAILSLVIDVKRYGPEKAFLDGAIVCLAMFVAVNFGHIFRFLQQKRILKKSQKHQKGVNVVRRGKMQEIPASQVVVGDVVLLGTGAQVPADGLFIDGSSFKLDDGLFERGANYASMFTGAKVVEGNCRMLVTSVGKNTEISKLINMVSVGNQRKLMDSKLQDGIDRLNSRLEKLWLSLSLLILMVQVLRCFVWKCACDESHNPDPKGVKNTVEEIVDESTKLLKKQGGKINGLVSMLCILLFATRDGLPLGIFILFFVVSKKMKFFSAMIQKLSTCATLGLVTTICLTKTSDLTMKHAEMAEVWIGLNHIKDISQEISGQVLGKLQEAVCMNSSGGQIEDSLLYWAQQVLDADVDDMYRNSEILHNGPVDREKDQNLLVLKRLEEKQEILDLHWRGPPDCILPRCSKYYEADGTMQALDEGKRAMFDKIVEQIASSNLPSFAFAWEKLIPEEPETPKPEKEGYLDDEKTLQVDRGLTLIGLVYLKNPYPPEVRQAIKALRDLGVNTKLLVDDNPKAARIMAIHSGILRREDDSELTVIDGSDFRNISEEVRMNMIDKIQVIANASPADKLLMVQCLKKKDEVVATVGSCIRDFPSLVNADVGIFMGEKNAEIAKDYADIVAGLSIATVGNILRLGRYACQSIEKFLELHLTLNISAFTTNLIFEASSIEVQLSSIQLLWTNLIVEALGAFALAVLMVEMEPSKSTQSQGKDRKSPPPVFGAGPVITKTMWRNIVIRSMFQVAILMVLGMKGKDMLHIDEDVLETMSFNSYVMCQVFTLIAAMKVTKKTIGNISRGEFSIENLLFLAVAGMMLALQMLLIVIMVAVAHWGSLNFKRWWICIGLAALCSPLASAARRGSDLVLPCN
ncbi:putative calcium-transporting ATPase 13, plasma membrane-type [Coffea eugenioides]|uniref:putative calcium-transporting ATPase 13, plasma membrane-type n=1 Tax=Coffea eugenioides TaxID=49369 RepID=UPI000F6086FB|nr:putative calcium-transporting ATPase 13, plasma membrane-type [Coffea eugenioides]